MVRSSSPIRSFLDIPAQSHFPVENLPYGIFSTATARQRRVGVAIGDQILDLALLADAGLVTSVPAAVFRHPSLNPLMSQGRPLWQALRNELTALLRSDNDALRDRADIRARALVPQAKATLHMPVEARGYTDFFCSIYHATNAGRLLRPDNPLMPNYRWLPVAYHGRASSVVVSGAPVRRPMGQYRVSGKDAPVFAPSARLDYELEMAFVIGKPSAGGASIGVGAAEDHMFGMVLLNDWSARDIQGWESAPLGPFNGKSFATTISPWIVTMEALAPFRVAGPRQEPPPLPYLAQTGASAFDIQVEAQLAAAGTSGTICRTNHKDLYWSVAQQLAHMTANGCGVEIGDLMGSGTLSGPTDESRACLLEATLAGKQAVDVAPGVKRTWLEDGDEVILTGWCEGAGFRVGFGEARGVIMPANQ